MDTPSLVCLWCGGSFSRPHGRGPAPAFCSRSHRERFNRQSKRQGRTQAVNEFASLNRLDGSAKDIVGSKAALEKIGSVGIVGNGAAKASADKFASLGGLGATVGMKSTIDKIRSAGIVGVSPKDALGVQATLGKIAPRLASVGVMGSLGLTRKDMLGIESTLAQAVPRIDVGALGAAAAFGLTTKEMTRLESTLGELLPKFNFGSTGVFGLGINDVAKMQRTFGEIVPKIDYLALASAVAGPLPVDLDQESNPLDPQSTQAGDLDKSLDQADIEALTRTAAVTLMVAVGLYLAVLSRHGLIEAAELLGSLVNFSMSAFGQADTNDPNFHGAVLTVMLLLGVFAIHIARRKRD